MFGQQGSWCSRWSRVNSPLLLRRACVHLSDHFERKMQQKSLLLLFAGYSNGLECSKNNGSCGIGRRCEPGVGAGNVECIPDCTLANGGCQPTEICLQNVESVTCQASSNFVQFSIISTPYSKLFTLIDHSVCP